MQKIWTEEKIRNEFRRLDEKTGLHGAELPISFGRARCTLGSYDCSGAFRFSDYYFQDPAWPRECAIDVIRHEYAHYMDHTLNGRGGHGNSWKQCCAKIGAIPERLYREERARIYQDREQKERQMSGSLDAYGVGTGIVHPVYGTGTIKSIVGSGSSRCVQVAFSDGRCILLSLSWIRDHCRAPK